MCQVPSVPDWKLVELRATLRFSPGNSPRKMRDLLRKVTTLARSSTGLRAQTMWFGAPKSRFAKTSTRFSKTLKSSKKCAKNSKNEQKKPKMVKYIANNYLMTFFFFFLFFFFRNRNFFKDVFWEIETLARLKIVKKSAMREGRTLSQSACTKSTKFSARPHRKITILHASF